MKDSIKKYLEKFGIWVALIFGLLIIGKLAFFSWSLFASNPEPVPHDIYQNQSATSLKKVDTGSKNDHVNQPIIDQIKHTFTSGNKLLFFDQTGLYLNNNGVNKLLTNFNYINSEYKFVATNFNNIAALHSKYNERFYINLNTGKIFYIYAPGNLIGTITTKIDNQNYYLGKNYNDQKCSPANLWTSEITGITLNTTSNDLSVVYNFAKPIPASCNVMGGDVGASLKYLGIGADLETVYLAVVPTNINQATNYYQVNLISKKTIQNDAQPEVIDPL